MSTTQTKKLTPEDQMPLTGVAPAPVVANPETALAGTVVTGTVVTGASAPVPAVQAEGFSDYAGVGFEGTGRDDMAIPFLSILQGLSPEVKRSDGAYIEGAQEGMILNTVTKEVVDTRGTKLTVVPCAYHRAFVEWRVRERGGGFIAEHDINTPLQNSTTRDERGRDILPNGNQLNDTRTFYVLLLDEENGSASPAVLTMTSTQIRKAKQWLMQQNLLKLNAGGRSYTPPMFASKWKIDTVPESNEKGSWFGWKFTHDGYLSGPDDPVFVLARDFHKSVQKGDTKVDLAKSEVAAGGKINPETGEPVLPDDDIPF